MRSECELYYLRPLSLHFIFIWQVLIEFRPGVLLGGQDTSSNQQQLSMPVIRQIQ